MHRIFTLFPQRPPELRHEVWRLVLTQSWAVTKYKLHGRHAQLVGLKPNPAVIGQACRKARAVMQRVLVKLDGRWSTPWREGVVFSGWINAARHLFYFRHIDYELGMMKGLAQDGLLSHVKHTIVHGQGWSTVFETVGLVKKYCPSLLTLVVIMLWFDPAFPTVQPSWIVHEDWGPLFRKTPEEIHWTPLLIAIEAADPQISRGTL